MFACTICSSPLSKIDEINCIRKYDLGRLQGNLFGSIWNRFYIFKVQAKLLSYICFLDFLKTVKRFCFELLMVFNLNLFANRALRDMLVLLEY